MKSTHSITITDVCKAIDAGDWCNQNLHPAQWQLNTLHLFSPNVRYEFGFFDTKHAMEFALRFA